MDELGIPPLDNSVDEVHRCNACSLNFILCVQGLLDEEYISMKEVRVV